MKLLKLLELLQQHTDEQHPMTTGSILAELEKLEIPCDRRTLAQDIAMLCQLDYEILSVPEGMVEQQIRAILSAKGVTLIDTAQGTQYKID